MANPLKGEIKLSLNNKEYKARLTIDALMQIEDALGQGIIKVAQRMGEGDVRIRDLVTVLLPALRGGGNDLQQTEKHNLHMGRFVKDYDERLKEHNNKFKVKTIFKNVYNRMIMYSGSEYHCANNFYCDNDRLTLAFFIKKLNVKNTPIDVIKGNIDKDIESQLEHYKFDWNDK